MPVYIFFRKRNKFQLTKQGTAYRCHKVGNDNLKSEWSLEVLGRAEQWSALGKLFRTAVRFETEFFSRTGL